MPPNIIKQKGNHTLIGNLNNYLLVLFGLPTLLVRMRTEHPETDTRQQVGMVPHISIVILNLVNNLHLPVDSMSVTGNPLIRNLEAK